MKKVLLSFFLLITLCASVSWAQDSRTLQKIKLKNGYILSGYVEPQSDGTYKVETTGGDIFYYSSSEISKIESSEAKKEKQAKKKAEIESLPLKEKGYIGILSGGFGLAVEDYPVVQFHFVNGIRFSKKFSMGLGIGFEAWDGCVIFPIQINARYSFTNRRYAPYLSGSAGVALIPEDGGSVLPIFQLDSGIRIANRNHPSAWWVGLLFGSSPYIRYYEGVAYEDIAPKIGLVVSYSF